MLRRIFAYATAGVIPFSISAIAYFFKSGGEGNFFLFFILVAGVVLGVIRKTSFFQSFKVLTIATYISLVAASLSLPNAFYYSRGYFYTIEDLHAPFDEAKEHLYVGLDHTQVQLDKEAAQHGANLFSQKENSGSFYAAMPMADKEGNPLKLFYMYYCNGFYQHTPLDFDQHQRILYDFQNEYNYNIHRYFRVVNGTNNSIGTANDGRVTKNATELRGASYKEVDYSVLVLAPIDFDPLWWRDFWRIAMVVTFAIYVFLVSVIIPKMVV